MTTTQPAAMPELLREIVAYCREAGHDWSSLNEAGHMLATLQAQQSTQGDTPAAEVSDEEISRLWSWSATAEAERTATTQQHAFAYALLAMRPQAAPMTREQRKAVVEAAEVLMKADINLPWRDALITATEAHHGITTQGAQGEQG